MNALKYFAILLLLLLTLTSLAQIDPSRTFLGKDVAKDRLSDALADPDNYAAYNERTEKLNDQQEAIQLAEDVVFKKFGKKNIIQQRPYEIHFIDDYWIISGTLPIRYDGGTFVIILDSKDGRTIRLYHEQ
jgi:hypothetical protein